MRTLPPGKRAVIPDPAAPPPVADRSGDWRCHISADQRAAGIDLHVATGRAEHKMRKAIVEAVYGSKSGRQTTGLSENTLHWHLQRIYKKKSIARQVDLVRLVLSIAEFG